ncbi:MAG TPA: hypothetical protein VFA07_16025 [Chthonomonadaceae bacterium]|nr:hypothetical protein [Chthonomonadaceae bacterium]
MKSNHVTQIAIALLVVLIIGVTLYVFSSWLDDPVPRVVVMLDASASNGLFDNSDPQRVAAAKRLLKPVISRCTDEKLLLIIISAKPVPRFLPIKGLTPDSLWDSVQSEVQERNRYEHQTGALRFGEGTNQGEAIHLLDEYYGKEQRPLLVISLTDGFSEKHSFKDIRNQLSALYSHHKNSLRFIVLGLSHAAPVAMSDTGQFQDVLELWRSAFVEEGATDLTVDQDAQRGFLLSDCLEAPRNAIRSF